MHSKSTGKEPHFACEPSCSYVKAHGHWTLAPGNLSYSASVLHTFLCLPRSLGAEACPPRAWPILIGGRPLLIPSFPRQPLLLMMKKGMWRPYSRSETVLRKFLLSHDLLSHDPRLVQRSKSSLPRGLKHQDPSTIQHRSLCRDHVTQRCAGQPSAKSWCLRCPWAPTGHDRRSPDIDDGVNRSAAFPVSGLLVLGYL